MDFHTKTVREVTSWLRTLPSFCITEEVITSFQGRFIMYEWEYFTISILEADMDGAAIATAISVGPDALQPLLSSLGKRLRVYQAIKEVT